MGDFIILSLYLLNLLLKDATNPGWNHLGYRVVQKIYIYERLKRETNFKWFREKSPWDSPCDNEALLRPQFVFFHKETRHLKEDYQTHESSQKTIWRTRRGLFTAAVQNLSFHGIRTSVYFVLFDGQFGFWSRTESWRSFCNVIIFKESRNISVITKSFWKSLK